MRDATALPTRSALVASTALATLLASSLVPGLAAAATDLACDNAPLDALHCEARPLDAAALARHCGALHAGDGPAAERLAALAELWRNAHPDAAMREAARACSARLDRLSTANPSADPAAGPAADARSARLMQSLAQLERRFERRLTEHAPRLRFRPQQLAGLDTAQVQLERSADGRWLTIGVGLGDYYPFMRQVHSESARRRMYLAHANRGGLANVQTLQQIVAQRQALAAARGHSSHYAGIADQLGLPSSDEVERFLATLAPAVNAAAQQELAVLRQRKQQAPPADASPLLHRWDALYFIEQERARRIGLAEDDAAAQLPTAAVLRWLPRYFGALAGVRFGPEPRPGWHGDVSCQRVALADGGRPLGTLCLDLFPRSGKYYNHASFLLPPLPGRPATRTAVLLANVDRESLTPDEVERLFAEYAVALAGLSGAGGEATAALPPQPLWQQLQRALFEQLAFSDEALALLAEDGTQLPAPEVLQALRANRLFAAGMTAARQLMVARFDFTLATASRPPDLMPLWRTLENASGLPYEPGSYYPSRLNALAGANAGLYYSLLWREAAAIDLVQQFGGHTLVPASRERLRLAFFGPPQHAPFAQRYQALAGRALSTDAFVQQLAAHTMTAPLQQAGAVAGGSPR